MATIYVTNPQKQKRLSLFAWLAAFFLIVILEYSGLFLIVRSGVLAISAPIAGKITQTVQFLEQPVRYFGQLQQLARRVQTLEQEYAMLVAELSQLEGVAAENEALRVFLNNADRTLQDTVLAGSIVSLARPAVSIGSKDGAVVGAEVLSQGVLLGTLTEVTNQVSYMTLLTQPDHDPVLARTASNTTGVLAGSGRLILMEEIALRDPIEIGDRVITIGQPGIKPDLVVGRVVSIEKDPASPVKKAHIEPVIDFYQTRVVEVLL